MSKTIVAIFAVLLLTALPALQQGQFMNRWGEPPNLQAAGKRLHDFPRQIGDWQSGADQRPLAEAVCDELGLTEHLHRRYTHRETGAQVEVLLMVGAPGKLVRHPPDVCYANRANKQLGDTRPLEIETGENAHDFKVLHFRRNQLPLESNFLVAYGFSPGDGLWTSPDSPRIQFGAAPVLYKLQVLTELSDDRGLAVLEEFLTQVAKAFPTVLVAEEDPR